jgi:glycosyltransferase involved in cell wall biosynthesis
MARVVIIQSHLKHYRLPFFTLLHSRLLHEGIELRVVYGKTNAEHLARKDNAEVMDEWAHKVRTMWFCERFVYHAAWREIGSADLVIVGNENKYLLNWPLLVLSAMKLKRVAFWGKGSNVLPEGKGLAERLRFRTCNSVDWWFAYTDQAALHLRNCGVTCGVSSVQNAVDTSEIRGHIREFTAEDERTGRADMKLGGGVVGIYCGNLSPNKNLDFLVDAARIVHVAIPGFKLAIVGTGPLQSWVEDVVTRERWIRYLGPLFGRRKSLALACADIFMLPGSVGLAILDGFAAGLPMLTTERHTHGPELDYMVQGVNGLITKLDVRQYASAVIGLLRDRCALQAMRTAANASAEHYSIENMVERFAQGIIACLSRKPS